MIKPEELKLATQWLHALRQEISKAVVGQTAVVEQLLVAVVASGHVLVEGVPGLGKTLLARALAQAVRLQYARLQFTPDLMPADVIGHSVLDDTGGGLGRLRVRKGPVFTNLLLADEINRAPAKTQSALLEVMQEFQATLEGQTLALPRPFMVMATQNPVDTEGTYPLPEAQLDRFLLKILIGYPTHAEETAVVELVTTGRAGHELPLDAVQPVLDDVQVQELQRLAGLVHADTKVIDYAVRVVRATRNWPGLEFGAGPRASVALVRAARAVALINGRDFITPDDIARQALAVLRHRVTMAPDAQIEGRDMDELLQAALQSVEAPRL
ncbi:AAA family ATPase [Roseateles depolymerans]|uniref:ATPase AAA n=1 Tax=Roseateles depolymerans TaxID=76731 RepID=A0A0U3N3A7_9BURK|nr:MoxR family ATPase [Roseateles depolymerans]ALV08660.1 ATPase AAA [Roseateles depolymerans]REG21114.1 MoxR-like ATPase [Roseateles depolymerans]